MDLILRKTVTLLKIGILELKVDFKQENSKDFPRYELSWDLSREVSTSNGEV